MKTAFKQKPNSFCVGKSLRRTVWGMGGFCALLSLAGCGDFFAEKPTELESRNIIRDISKINYAPESQIPMPEVYNSPPRIVEGKIGEVKDAKLFYFTRYHTPQELAKIVNEQFTKKFFDSKGKPYPVRDYGVSINAGANQIIVRCPSVADAEGVRELLEQIDVPPIQVKIDCLISEVYADHTMDWETTIDIQNLFGTGMALGGKKIIEGTDENPIETLLPAFPGAALRDIARSTFGLKVGYVHNEGVAGHEVKALVDLLESRGYLKILMHPTLEVINGKTATIETEELIPMDQIRDVHPVTGNISYTTRYEPVIDSLEITPTVFADGYIGIRTKAVIGSKSTPEGVKQVPIVTKREIKVEENRIRPGESLVIGGITKSEKRSVVRGVPFLKDIPLIGILFSSKDFEERGKEVLFILTPTISTGGLPNKEIVDDIREKHEMLKLEGNIIDAITDPLGQRIYTDLVEKEATKAETERIKARIEKTHAERKSKWLEQELKSATERTAIERSEAERIRSEKKRIQAEIEKLKQEAAKIRQEAEAAKTKAKKAEAQAVEAKKAAEKTKADYETQIANWLKEREKKNGKATAEKTPEPAKENKPQK